MEIPTPDQVNEFLVDAFPAADRDGYRCEHLDDRAAEPPAGLI